MLRGEEQRDSVGLIRDLRTWYRGVHGGIDGHRLSPLARIARALILVTPLVFIVVALPARKTVVQGFRSQPALFGFALGWSILVGTVVLVSRRFQLNTKAASTCAVLLTLPLWPIVASATGTAQLVVGVGALVVVGALSLLVGALRRSRSGGEQTRDSGQHSGDSG